VLLPTTTITPQLVTTFHKHGRSFSFLDIDKPINKNYTQVLTYEIALEAILFG
jgi:hypothetical protein